MNKLEGVKKITEDYHTKIVGNRYKKKIEEKGLGEATKDLMGAMGVSVLSKRENDPEFSEMRKKLSTEPGIVIANHPGQYDALAILSTLNRQDIKFMVAGNVYEALSSVFGEERIIEAKRDGRKDLLDTLNGILKHIENGGLFIYFPTGGRETWSTDAKFEFFSSFRYLVEKMNSKDMVYSMNINPVSTNPERSGLSIERVVRESAFASDSGREIPILSKRAKPFTLEIDENYSQAGEWKNIIESEGSNPVKNKMLTLNYLEKFSKSS